MSASNHPSEKGFKEGANMPGGEQFNSAQDGKLESGTHNSGHPANDHIATSRQTGITQPTMSSRDHLEAEPKGRSFDQQTHSGTASVASMGASGTGGGQQAISDQGSQAGQGAAPTDGIAGSHPGGQEPAGQDVNAGQTDQQKSGAGRTDDILSDGTDGGSPDGFRGSAPGAPQGGVVEQDKSR